MQNTLGGLFKIILLFFGCFLGVRYVLPLIAPFVFGGLLALAAEPMVRFFCGKCRLRRGAAAGLGVSLTVLLLAMVLVSLCGLIIRELSTLSGILPELEESIRSGMGSLSGWLLGVIGRAPEGIRGILSRGISDLFSDGSALLDRGMDFLLRLASGLLSRVPGGALMLATAVISSFMISAKLPVIRAFVKRKLPIERLRPVLATLKNLKTVVLGWLKAQLKLMTVTFAIVAAGFGLLGIRYWFLWAPLVALVDALPILGSGTVLVPWSLVSFLQGDPARAFALLGVYAAAALTRSVLEPRLVGRQLGLDPLVTLMALYIGYRLFGFLGLILAPMLAMAAVQLAGAAKSEESE